MANMEFVNVKRLEHGDVMFIPLMVAQQYPNKFEIIPEKVEETVATEVVVVDEPPKKRRVKK